MGSHDQPDFPEPAPGALESAIAALERGLCADGAVARAIPEGERAGWEWRILFGWARQNGCVLPPSLAPERSGGREHDLTHLPGRRAWLKFTKPDACGYTVELVDGAPLFLPATPLQYLHRIQAQNEIWGDEIKLIGLRDLTPGARLLTLQPDISGEAPDWTDLHAFLDEAAGFQRLEIPPMGYYKSASYLRDDVAMFDVHPANFVRTRDGVIVPIDVILVRFAEADREALRVR